MVHKWTRHSKTMKPRKYQQICTSQHRTPICQSQKYGERSPRQGPNGHSKFQSFGMYAYLGHLQYVGNGIDRSLDVRSSQTVHSNLVGPTEMPPSCVSVITTMRLPSNTALPYRQGCWLKLGAIQSPFEGPQFKWPVLGRGQACQLQLGWSEIAF